MKSAKPGQHTSPAEVTNVSVHGFWILIQDKEHFLSFNDFPWFKDAAISQLVNVELQSPQHLYWPDLDIDLSVESIEFPERFPLVSAVRPARPSQRLRSKAARR
jgi:hypothetical protein